MLSIVKQKTVYNTGDVQNQIARNIQNVNTLDLQEELLKQEWENTNKMFEAKI